MDKYITVELQTNADGTVGNIVRSFDSQAQAESAYHSILAAAAAARLPSHAAVLMDGRGTVMESRCYDHGEAS